MAWAGPAEKSNGHPQVATCWSSPEPGIAREIIEAQADYLLAVKENQGRLYDALRPFQGAEEYDGTSPQQGPLSRGRPGWRMDSTTYSTHMRAKPGSN